MTSTIVCGHPSKLLNFFIVTNSDEMKKFGSIVIYHVVNESKITISLFFILCRYGMITVLIYAVLLYVIALNQGMYTHY